MGRGGLGVTLILMAFIPIFSVAIYENSVSPIVSEAIWATLGVAIGIGALAAFNFLGSGLNSAGTAITFVLAEAITFYADGIYPIYGNNVFQSMPYYGWIQAITDFMFGLGIYFLASTGGHEN